MGRNGLFFRNGSFGEFLRIRGGTIDGKERSLLSERQFRWISKNAGNCARNVSSFETVMIGNRVQSLIVKKLFFYSERELAFGIFF
ncbi:unnamed protein product [Rhizophagus irregularis]|nr:unnamed protein product [Rhizophagus irregularis]